MTTDFTFVHNNSVFKNNNIIQENITVYTLSDQFEYQEQDINNNTLMTHNGEPICAKSVIRTDGTKKYMIRLDSNNKFYNPISIYGTEHNKTFLDRICRSNEKFKEVSEKTLNLYVKFLQTKNILWLTNAEREAE